MVCRKSIDETDIKINSKYEDNIKDIKSIHRRYEEAEAMQDVEKHNRLQPSGKQDRVES